MAGPVALTARSAVVYAVIRHELPPELLESLPEISTDASTRSTLSGWLALLPSDGWLTGVNALLFYLLGPDPLEILHQRVLGIPDQAAGGS